MTAEENFYMIDDNDTSEFNQVVDSFISNKFISREKLNEKLDAWKKEKLNIGIIGETSSGKSNLINTFRGLFFFQLTKEHLKLKLHKQQIFPNHMMIHSIRTLNIGIHLGIMVLNRFHLPQTT